VPGEETTGESQLAMFAPLRACRGKLLTSHHEAMAILVGLQTLFDLLVLLERLLFGDLTEPTSNQLCCCQIRKKTNDPA